MANIQPTLRSLEIKYCFLAL